MFQINRDGGGGWMGVSLRKIEFSKITSKIHGGVQVCTQGSFICPVLSPLSCFMWK